MIHLAQCSSSGGWSNCVESDTTIDSRNVYLEPETIRRDGRISDIGLTYRNPLIAGPDRNSYCACARTNPRATEIRPSWNSAYQLSICAARSRCLHQQGTSSRDCYVSAMRTFSLRRPVGWQPQAKPHPRKTGELVCVKEHRA
jgi:hypothetical protein